jgi:hypothetical protein
LRQSRTQALHFPGTLRQGCPALVQYVHQTSQIVGSNKEFGEAKHHKYLATVGLLMYAATMSCPNVAQAVNLLTRTAMKWSKQHVHAAKHILSYLQGTSKLYLTFDAMYSKRVALRYTDADWGGCLDTH